MSREDVDGEVDRPVSTRTPFSSTKRRFSAPLAAAVWTTSFIMPSTRNSTTVVFPGSRATGGARSDAHPGATPRQRIAATSQSTAAQKGGHHRVFATNCVRSCQASLKPWAA